MKIFFINFHVIGQFKRDISRNYNVFTRDNAALWKSLSVMFQLHQYHIRYVLYGIGYTETQMSPLEWVGFATDCNETTKFSFQRILHQGEMGLNLMGDSWCKLTHLRPGQNSRHFADDIFWCIFANEKFYILNRISLKFVPKGPIDNNPALV